MGGKGVLAGDKRFQKMLVEAVAAVALEEFLGGRIVSHEFACGGKYDGRFGEGFQQEMRAAGWAEERK